MYTSQASLQGLPLKLPSESTYQLHGYNQGSSMLQQSADQRIPVYKHDEIEGVCLLNELPIKYTLDTGAEITVISDRAYSSLKHPTILEPVPNLIASAGGSGLTVLGRSYALITIGEVSIFTFLVVIKDLVVDCLLGMDLLQQFPFFKKPIDEFRKVLVQMSKQVTIKPRFNLMNVYNSSSIAASSLRELKPSQCFEHIIQLMNPNIEPIRQKTRRIPYSAREEFKKMLDEMLDNNQKVVNCVIKRSETGDTDLSVVVISKDDDSDGAHKHVNFISKRIECEATDPTQRVVVTSEE
ncbi:hypothetical protein BpHYR1_046587, partial [Brachionus plicatilis]